ncbi:MAG: Hpt domain-containing protein [Formivibrio sp.]|nr:Hpt domain-containing protein [Formivibrio sp.]
MLHENSEQELAANPTQTGLTYHADKALAMLNGDAELLKELTLLFLAETPIRLKQLNQALATEDSKSINHTAHAIKGSLGAIGALQTMATAQELENAARIASWENIVPLTQQFNAEYTQLCIMLKQMFRN